MFEDVWGVGFKRGTEIVITGKLSGLKNSQDVSGKSKNMKEFLGFPENIPDYSTVWRFRMRRIRLIRGIASPLPLRPTFGRTRPIEDGILRKGFLKACGEDDIHLTDQEGETWVMDGD